MDTMTETKVWAVHDGLDDDRQLTPWTRDRHVAERAAETIRKGMPAEAARWVYLVGLEVTS